MVEIAPLEKLRNKSANEQSSVNFVLAPDKIQYVHLLEYSFLVISCDHTGLNTPQSTIATNLNTHLLKLIGGQRYSKCYAKFSMVPLVTRLLQKRLLLNGNDLPWRR